MGGDGGGGGWVPSKNLVTSDRLVRVSRSRSESVTILVFYTYKLLENIKVHTNKQILLSSIWISHLKTKTITHIREYNAIKRALDVAINCEKELVTK